MKRINNKKGFTLVELLAVIVILALLIVITVNTIVPMLTRTKKTGMITYAERVLNNANTAIEADKVTTGISDSGKIYTIAGDLTDREEYFGCVKVNISSNNVVSYNIKMYSANDKLYLEDILEDENDQKIGIAPESIANLSGKVEVVERTGTTDYDDLEELCEEDFDNLTSED